MKVIGRLYCRHVTTGGAAVEGGAAWTLWTLPCHNSPLSTPRVCPVVYK